MTGMLALPLVVALALAATLVPLTDRVTPAQAARSLGVALTAVLAAAWATAWALTLAYIAHHPLIGGHFVWCRQIAGLHHPPPPLVGETSLIITTASTGRLLQVVERLKEGGTTIVIVEQSLNVALAMADRAVFLEKGEVRFEGAAQDLLERDDLARAVFLGREGG